MKPIRIKRLPFDLARLQREVNILLLSDLHYDIEKDSTVKPYRRGLVVNKKLIESIQSAGHDWCPDIVIIAGDLVNQNGKKNYDHYWDLMKKLVTSFPALRNAVFTTPGNHDINRDNFMSVLPYLKKMANCKPDNVIKSYTNNKWVDILHTLTKRRFNSNKTLPGLLSKYEKKYFERYLENRTRLATEIPKNRRRTLLGNPELEFPVDGIQTTYYKQIHGLTLVCHNSAFFCDISQATNDRNHLFLVRDIVDRSIDKIKALQNPGPVISFLHHPFYYLHETEHVAPVPVDEKEKDPFNNFNKIVRTSDLVFSGHVHGELHDPSYLQNSAYLITNGTSYTSEDLFKNKCYPYTYALIKVNKQLRKFSLKKYRYEENPKKTNANYVCRHGQPEDLKPYNLLDRPGAVPTSVEIEKVRTIDYFSKIIDKDHQRLKFFLCQLSIYHDEMGPFGAGVYKYSETYDWKLRAKIFKISRGFKYPISIILIEAENNLKQVTDILKKNLNDLNSKDGVIYFSVNRKLLYEIMIDQTGKKYRTDKLLTGDLQRLQNTFRVLALSSKINYLSINLLYH